MKSRTLFVSALAVAVAVPGLAAAQTLLNTLGFINALVNGLIPLFISLALVAFFYGLVTYLFKEGAEGKASGLKIMGMGIAAIFVMVSIWGIIAVLRTTFNVERNEAIVPSVPQLR